MHIMYFDQIHPAYFSLSKPLCFLPTLFSIFSGFHYAIFFLLLHACTVIFIFYFFIVVLAVHCCIYKSFSNVSIEYIILEFTPSIILLYPFSSAPGIVVTGLIFPFTYMCTQMFATLFSHIYIMLLLSCSSSYHPLLSPTYFAYLK
jgi:hypothetical protein